jgi:aspartate/methionine/tyrosine aminotransferase
MTSLSERLNAPASTTIFERMSGLARELGAINLGQGFPEWEEPRELVEAAQRALAERSNQYPPMRGLPELRGAIAAYYAREQGMAMDPHRPSLHADHTGERFHFCSQGCLNMLISAES